MSKIYGVVFKNKGKVYNFKTTDENIELETKVIVETEKGLQYGKVVKEILENDGKNYKDIIRLVDKNDEQNHLKNLADADKALNKARSLAKEMNLEMNFIDASFTFDRKQLLLNFLADQRIDFRELVKKLASLYHSRIELRQIGVRDKAKEIGGLGICGREICCKSFLNNMESVNINMAKNQNIALNPSKINGICGRLLCCFNYEDEEYHFCRALLPQIGDKIKTEKGEGIVTGLDILQKKVTVKVGNEKVVIVFGENKVK